jgi:hypothetical protein
MPAAASRRKQKSHRGHALELDPALSKAHLALLALVNLYIFQQRSEDAASELRAFRGGNRLPVRRLDLVKSKLVVANVSICGNGRLMGLTPNHSAYQARRRWEPRS